MIVAANRGSGGGHAVVVGGSGVLGEAIVAALAAEGRVVGIVYRHDAARADAVMAGLRDAAGDVYAVQADATDPESVRQVVDATFARTPVSLWINAVGGFLRASIEATPYEAWQRILAENLDSAFLCCREVVRRMREAGGGAIINLGVAGAEAGRSAPNAVAYLAAKSGLVSLTRSLARSEGPHGIRDNQVNPGYIAGGRDSPAEPPSRVLLRRLGRPEEVADAVRFLASNEAGYITGAVLNVDGGAFL
jgi:3-oxoacyl-[acyl-carrier protein] reductase